MKRIEAIVRHLLIHRKKVVLPGIGLLHLYRTPANVRTQEGLIDPPFEELLFTETGQLGEAHFMDQLQSLPLHPDTDLLRIQDEMSAFCRKADQAGFLQIGSIVRLQKQDGYWRLEASQLEGISPFAALKALELPPLLTMVSPETQEQLVMKAKPAPRNRSRAMVFTLSLLFILLSVMLWWLLPEVQEQRESFSKVFVHEERVNVSPSEIEAIDPLNRDSMQEAHDQEPELAEEEETLQREEHFKDTLAIDVQRDETTIEEDKTKEEEILSVQEECVIIVGAFSKASNVRSMKQKLSDLGYDVYTQEYRGLTRVGLYSVCIEEDLDSILAVCRENIESASWILEGNK